MIGTALRKGRELSLKPLCVVVIDAGGHLLALQREDGASNLRPKIALAKASGALALGMSSRQIGDVALERPNFINAVTQLATDGVMPAAGGLILRRPTGEQVGAIGITGDTSDNDEICALAGAKAASLSGA